MIVASNLRRSRIRYAIRDAIRVYVCKQKVISPAQACAPRKSPVLLKVVPRRRVGMGVRPSHVPALALPIICVQSCPTRRWLQHRRKSKLPSHGEFRLTCIPPPTSVLSSRGSSPSLRCSWIRGTVTRLHSLPYVLHAANCP